MSVIDFTKILKGHSSGWVAISKDCKKIVASGRTLKETANKINKLGKSDIFYFPAAKSYSNFVGIA